MFFSDLHALWYIRVSDAIPVLKHKGILSIFEYSRPLHPPLTPFIQYWGTLMRDRFPVLNTPPKLKNLPKVNASTRTILVTICSEGYFKVYFLFEDYFGDYFQFGNYFLEKLSSK